MPTKWEFVRKTKAPVAKAMDYFSHPENLSKLHSEFVKQVTIKNNQGDTIEFEQQMELMKKKLVSQNKMTINRQSNQIVIDTLDGDGKGSKIMMILTELPGGAGTEIKYDAAMELGRLGLFAKGPAKSSMEKVADEDAKNLDAM